MGTISAPPPQVTAISGPWDAGMTRQEGEWTVYWVWYEAPQFDAEGDGPYSGSSIRESAMRRL
jgi:hypothetical protein